jgi:hypothetical protein
LFLDKYFKNIFYIFLFVFIDLIYQKIFGVDVVGEQTIQFAQETTESVFGQKTIKFNQHLAKRL